MVSMKDISVACGVSIATVSKALNGHKDISEDTKRLIKNKADEMGYFPNSSARALKMNKSYNLGVLLMDEARSGLTHNYFASILESFKFTAEKRGYDITFISGSRQRKDKMSFLECCRYRGIDGVVIACINFHDTEVYDLIQSELPVVTIDHIFNSRIAIISDNVKGVKELINYIYQCGHRKIAFINAGDGSSVTNARISSFYRTVYELGLDIPEEYVRAAHYRDTEATAKITNELLDLSDPPTCIMFQDDFASIGGINAIKARGLMIPEDISVTGYDGIQLVKYMEPVLTTVCQDTKRMGQYAAERLIDMIEKPKATIIEHIVIPPKLDMGATVGKIG